jgi:hypothetical protein
MTVCRENSVIEEKRLQAERNGVSDLMVSEEAAEKTLQAVGRSIEEDVPVRREIVFLPYKAAMWDSLESVWSRACEDDTCAVYVIPIPYFDKDQDGNVYAMHYEGDQFPANVPITSYQTYSLKDSHPDMIYIHNPYDEHNTITTVHPDFYSTKLREYTDQLVYIPYFVLGEIEPKNKQAVQGISHFVTQPGVVNAHKVIVQSEAMKQAYVEALTQWAGEDSRPVWEKKIEGTGSPKFDKLRGYSREMAWEQLPQEWKAIILKNDTAEADSRKTADGAENRQIKKIVLYNNSINALLAHRGQMLEKLRRVLQIFYENRENVALLWRPHPLMESTIRANCPELLDAYQNIVLEYRQAGWGIYDDTAELDRAVVAADAYYGDPSSLVQLFRTLGKPIMIQNVNC